MTPPRILIAAENASCRMGGEAILPFHYFRVLRARGLDAHLIVHERTRAELLELFPGESGRLHFIGDRPLQKLLFRLGRFFPRRIAESTFGLATSLLTQRAQRAVLSGLLQGRTVIHQPTPVSPRYPSWLSGLGAPLVLGPLNGGMEYPPAFHTAESMLSRTLVAVGRSLSDFTNRLIPGKRDASLVLVANQRTLAALPAGVSGHVLELPENAVDLTQYKPAPASSASSKTFVFIGRLVDWKALDLLLEALTRVPQAKLQIIGDGPMLASWRALAVSLGLADRVSFLGFLPQSACAAHLAEAVALVLPSLYECGGAVVLEAMATARPAIATAWGGPADYLDATCGILIPPSGRSALVDGFAKAMQLLLDDPAHACALGLAGRQRLVRHFDWEAKVDTLLNLYDQVLHDQAPAKEVLNKKALGNQVSAKQVSAKEVSPAG